MEEKNEVELPAGEKGDDVHMRQNQSAKLPIDNIAAAPEVHRVSIKIPPFWNERPEVWFFQVEAQFSIAGITSEETKFNYLVAQLEPKYVDSVWDIVTGTSKKKYTDAKERLLALFQDSEANRLKKLVTGIEMGDMKPSLFLQKLRTVATKDISENLLKTLWLEKLPDSMKNIILVSDAELSKLAEMADKIADMNPQRSICAATAPNLELMDRIAMLEQQIATLTVQHRHRRAERQPSRSRSRSRSRRRFNPKGSYCFYHFKFGDKCYPEKCKQPCSYKTSENLTA